MPTLWFKDMTLFKEHNKVVAFPMKHRKHLDLR